MANKTKSKSKRHYKKKSKKIYGGTKPPNGSSLSNFGKQQLTNYAMSKLPLDSSSSPMTNKMTSQISKKYLQQTDTNATPESNLKLFIKIIVSELNLVTETILKTASETMNIDLKQSDEILMMELKDKLKKVVDILKSEEVRGLLEETFNEGLAIYIPLIYKAADSLNELAEKEVKVGVRIVNTAITEIPIVFFIVEFINFLTTVITALKAVAQFVPALAESIQKIEDFKNKLTQAKGQLSSLVKEKLESESKFIDSTKNPLPLKLENGMPPAAGGGLMKKLMKERKMIGGSIEKSRVDFLTLSQLIIPHNKKPYQNKSKKHYKR
jgi:hypothetical protein